MQTCNNLNLHDVQRPDEAIGVHVFLSEGPRGNSHLFKSCSHCFTITESVHIVVDNGSWREILNVVGYCFFLKSRLAFLSCACSTYRLLCSALRINSDENFVEMSQNTRFRVQRRSNTTTRQNQAPHGHGNFRIIIVEV